MTSLFMCTCKSPAAILRLDWTFSLHTEEVSWILEVSWRRVVQRFDDASIDEVSKSYDSTMDAMELAIHAPDSIRASIQI